MWQCINCGWQYENHRRVCYAVNAGYAEYEGLPGVIKTGCPNTPVYKSHFCTLHTPSTATETTDTSLEKPKGMSYNLLWSDTDTLVHSIV